MNLLPRFYASCPSLVIWLNLMWHSQALSIENQFYTQKTNHTAPAELRQYNANSSTPLKKSGKLYERIGDAKRASKHADDAFRAYKNALEVFSRAGDSVNRHRLLKKLSKKLPGWPTKYQTKMRKLQNAWKKIRLLSKQALNLPRRPSGSDELDTNTFQITQDAIDLVELAKKQNDHELLALSLEAEGRALAAAGYADEELAKYRAAAAACGDGACPKTKKAILNRAAKTLEKQNNLIAAFELFALANAEDTLDLPEDKKRYRRSHAMVRLCAKLVSSKIKPSCLELERKTTGFVTFTDFSIPPPTHKLERSKINEVHDQYFPLLVSCLRKATHKGEIEPGEILELSWTVLNDGKTDNFTCYPSIEETELEACIQEALATFRYPSYRGERQNITLPLSVGTR